MTTSKTALRAKPARWTTEARYDEIVALIRQRGFVTIEMLAKHFGVTLQTIRRDLNLLSAEGRVFRYHGGAGLPSSVENVDYHARQIMQLAEKQRIARLAAAHVPDHSSLFINIGTTTEAVARELVNHKDLRVITNNLNVAVILTRQTSFEVIIAGGKVRNQDGGIVGQDASDMLEQFRVDYGIIGISGIETDGTLLDFDYHEVRAAQTIMRRARRIFLVADHTKFSRKPMVRLGSIAQVSAFFTDEPPPPPIRSLLAEHDVELKVAGPA